MGGKREQGRKRRLMARFEGRVQGVGFRYTAVSVASRFDVQGFVRNEPDGSVLLVAEGLDAELLALVRAIKDTHLLRYITADRQSWSDATGEFTGFTVKHGW